MMNIEKQSNDVFKVIVSGSVTTQHAVIITDDVHQDLTSGRVSKEELLDFSFRFLLDREPNSSILLSFEIMVIDRYFTEYKSEVRKWCAKKV